MTTTCSTCNGNGFAITGCRECGRKSLPWDNPEDIERFKTEVASKFDRTQACLNFINHCEMARMELDRLGYLSESHALDVLKLSVLRQEHAKL